MTGDLNPSPLHSKLAACIIITIIAIIILIIGSIVSIVIVKMEMRVETDMQMAGSSSGLGTAVEPMEPVSIYARSAHGAVAAAQRGPGRGGAGNRIHAP